MVGKNPDTILNFTAIDFETACGYRNSVCQVGLVEVRDGIVVGEYCELIRPPNNFIRADFTDLHGISPDDTMHAPPFAKSYPRWKHFVEGRTLVAHNMQFDLGCLLTCLKSFCNMDAAFKTYCTMKIWKGAFENTKLATCCKKLGIELHQHHNALVDAHACAELFLAAIREKRELQ